MVAWAVKGEYNRDVLSHPATEKVLHAKEFLTRRVGKGCIYVFVGRFVKGMPKSCYID